MIFANICQFCEQARNIKTLLLILLSLGVLLACNVQTLRPVFQEPEKNPRGEIIRPPPIQSHPNQRVALVIGNGAYQKKPLDNPPNDSDDMARVLKQVGFEVMLVKNASLEAMETAIQEFGEKLKKGGTGLFYFAGHGAQYQGENYLFPIGAMRSVTVAQHLRHRTMSVGYILATMEGAKNNLNIVILDACRNNPFARSLFRGVDSPEGLALLEVPSGTLIAYATRPNKTALDSTGGRNSPYVKHLKRELLKPGISILKALTNVRVAVKKETKNRQAPGFYSELDREFCFVGPCGQVVAQTQPVPSQPVAPPATSPTPVADRDRDGVADSEDKCPDNTSAEKAKGVYKEGSKIGCPMESDNDGVPDYRDNCPYNRSEELAQGVDKRGCPLDRDQDGVADYRDKCPRNQSKEISAGVDSGGCPLDTDRDGVADYRDNCLRNQSKEIAQGVDKRGCPLDRDLDGVADYRDSCLGTSAGVKVKPNGCPVPKTTVSKPSSSRYSDNGDGTVTDNRTGLIWLKKANCSGRMTWKEAMQWAAKLAKGQCGLREGSRAGMWRLPTRDEWKAMMDKRYKAPALSNAAGTGQWKEGDVFSGVQWFYWSSTTSGSSSAWNVHLNDGVVIYNVKSGTDYVWAVRGGP